MKNIHQVVINTMIFVIVFGDAIQVHIISLRMYDCLSI